MPATYRFEAPIVVIETFNLFSLEDISKTLVDAIADPRCPPDARLLVNLGETQPVFKKSAEDFNMMSLIALQGKYFHHRIAVVAPGDLAFGLMRKDAVRAEEKGVDTEIFRDCNTARRWLMSSNSASGD